jgi:hypothetical protein
MKKKKLVEGVDFYYNEMGYIVLTAQYHLEKGNCCGNGCLHCPFDYMNVPEPRRSELIAERRYEKKDSEHS